MFYKSACLYYWCNCKLILKIHYYSAWTGTWSSTEFPQMVSNEKVLPQSTGTVLSCLPTVLPSVSTTVHSSRKLLEVMSLYIYLSILLAVLTLDQWLCLVSNFLPIQSLLALLDESWVNAHYQWYATLDLFLPPDFCVLDSGFDKRQSEWSEWEEVGTQGETSISGVTFAGMYSSLNMPPPLLLGIFVPAVSSTWF